MHLSLSDQRREKSPANLQIPSRTLPLLPFCVKDGPIAEALPKNCHEIPPFIGLDKGFSNLDSTSMVSQCVVQTPLKMAQFYTALARDGSAPAPAIAQGVELGEGWSLNLAPEHLASLREGLRMVTAPGGTAHYAGTLEHWEVLGKTGTGQNALSVQGLAEDHAWFAAIVGPFGGAPEIVVVSLVEHGASGSQVAAPIATKAADFYLRKKHGIPQDTIQTLREWLQTRGWPAWYGERFAGGGP